MVVLKTFRLKANLNEFLRRGIKLDYEKDLVTWGDTQIKRLPVDGSAPRNVIILMNLIAWPGYWRLLSFSVAQRAQSQPTQNDKSSTGFAR